MLYERLGGLEGCRRLAGAFHARVGRDPALRTMFPRDTEASTERLALFLAELLGGPPVYSLARGRPRMRKRHQRFAIGPAERDAWLGHMGAALVEVGVDEATRATLEPFFAMAAAGLVNGAGGGGRPAGCTVDRSNPLSPRLF
ncbi:MAG TPA: globin [Chloroflexota bacterium]|jgi:hemoglobin